MSRVLAHSGETALRKYRTTGPPSLTRSTGSSEELPSQAVRLAGDTAQAAETITSSTTGALLSSQFR